MISIEPDVRNAENAFTPFVLSLKVNTLKDAQALHFLFNYVPIERTVLGMEDGPDVYPLDPATQCRAFIENHCPLGTNFDESFTALRIKLEKAIERA